jgi:hypothetical protein
VVTAYRLKLRITAKIMLSKKGSKVVRHVQDPEMDESRWMIGGQ